MYMMLDVETNGLQGEVFAVGFCLFNPSGVIEREDWRYCHYNLTDSWCKEHIPRFNDPDKRLENPEALRFWFVQKHNIYNSPIIIADHIFPCESNFLTLCAKEYNKIFYPVIDSHAVKHAFEYNTNFPEFSPNRLESELPIHHPMYDCRQSVREYCYYLNLLRKNV